MLRHGVAEATTSQDGTSFTCLDYSRSLCCLGYSDSSISFFYMDGSGDERMNHRLRTDCILKIAPEEEADQSLRSPVTCLRISPCQCFLGIGTANGTVTVLDLRTNGEHYEYSVSKIMNFRLLAHPEAWGRPLQR